MVQWKAETKLGHSFNELITRQSINQPINHHAHQSSDPLIPYQYSKDALKYAKGYNRVVRPN